MKEPIGKVFWYLVLASFVTAMIAIALWYVDEVSANVIVQSCGKEFCVENGATSYWGKLDESAPKQGTKAWLTSCYNQFDSYEKRIRFCK